MALLVCVPGPGLAESCFAPSRPLLPSDTQAARDYVGIIRGDFEEYILDIRNYFRRLDGEWARAFEEAREVSEDYAFQVLERSD